MDIFHTAYKGDPLTLGILGTKLVTYGDGAFSVTGAVEWNNLPMQIRAADSVK